MLIQTSQNTTDTPPNQSNNHSINPESCPAFSPYLTNVSTMNLVVPEDELFILPVPCISEFKGEILILFHPHVFWKILILYPGINSPILWSTCKHLLSQIMSFVSQIVGNKLIDFSPNLQTLQFHWMTFIIYLTFIFSPSKSSSFPITYFIGYLLVLNLLNQNLVG